MRARSWVPPRVAGLAVPFLAGGAAVVAGVGAASPLLATVGPLAVLVVTVERRRVLGRRRRAARADAAPVVVDHLAQGLQSGSSLTQACRSLGRIDGSHPGPLDGLVDGLERGSTLGQAIEALERRATDLDPSERLIITTLGLLSRNGGPALPALRRLRHTLVGRAHRHHRAAAQASSALASARLLAAAPVGFAGALAAIEPALARFYATEAIGALCAAGSLTLSAAGWFWMQAIVARAIEDVG